MPRSDLCTQEEVTDLVHGFYAKVREDDLLGPIFDAHIKDWGPHLAKMVDFWSSTLRGTATYRGTPMPKHVALPGLTPELFHRWLRLFRETTEDIPNAAMGEQANDLAQRIAQSLWYGYQMYRKPDTLPSEMADA